MRFFDTHAHFSGPPLEVAADLMRAQEAGVGRVIAVGGSTALNAGALAAVRAFPEFAGLALGFDRDQAMSAPPEAHVATLRQLAQAHPLIAVGETGLDFHYQPETAPQQRALFASQLELASEWRLPVIIHTRESDSATLEVLDATPWHGEGLRGVVHCFTGNREFARHLLDRSLAISFSGIVTFRNADMLRESAAYVPDDRLLIETDSPFLAPVPQRGKRNEPAYVVHVAECLAKVRGVALGEIAELTYDNACRLFGIA